MDTGTLLRSLLAGLVTGFLALWSCWLLLRVAYALKLALRHFEQQRLLASGLADPDRMDGREFEE